MRTSTILLSLFATLTLSAPLTRRAAVLGTATYDELSISGGTAGNAEAEALARFSALDLNDSMYFLLFITKDLPSLLQRGFAEDRIVANVDQADIDFLGAVNDIANDAETDAFNVAIVAASGDELTALQVCSHSSPSPSFSSPSDPHPAQSPSPQILKP
jgi:hypothetical protein